MAYEQHIKLLAYHLDPAAFTSYSGLPPWEKREWEARRVAAIRNAGDMWIRDPKTCEARITCMCGELMHNHPDRDLGHSAVSVYDHHHAQPPEVQPQESTMLNMSKAVFLLNPNVRSIGVAYDTKDLDTAIKGRAKLYHFKSLDKTLKPGDKVVVPSSVTNMGMALGLVVEVDTPVNYDSHDFQMVWILGTIDEKAMDSIKAMEQEVITKVKLAEDHKRRKELRDALLDSIDPEQLAITHVGEAEVVDQNTMDEVNPGAAEPPRS